MIIDILVFVGMGLYFLSACGFLYLFLRTLKSKDGIGLQFLRYLTLSLFFGSTTIFAVRFWSLYGTLDSDVARAIAVINPITLLAVVLYLNYLFHHPSPIVKSGDRQKIVQTNKNVKEIKKDVKIIKRKVL